MLEETAKTTILIVDDMPSSIQILSKFLQNEYRIIFAQNGEEAIKIAMSETPLDLI